MERDGRGRGGKSFRLFLSLLRPPLRSKMTWQVRKLYRMTKSVCIVDDDF